MRLATRDALSSRSVGTTERICDAAGAGVPEPRRSLRLRQAKVAAERSLVLVAESVPAGALGLAAREVLHEHPARDASLLEQAAFHPRKVADEGPAPGLRRGCPFPSSTPISAGVRSLPTDAFEAGCEIGALTHGHPSGYLTAGYFAGLINRVIEGAPLLWAAAVEKLDDLPRRLEPTRPAAARPRKSPR